jgi:hypothetical protein
MRIRSLAALLGIAAIALLACNTTGSRIRGQQELFDSYPPEVQENLRNGIVEVGYTTEMVAMALGEPDHKAAAKPEDEVEEVWTYRKSVPGFGIGMGTGGYAGAGVSIGTGVRVGEPARSHDRAVVEFSDGRVKRFRTLESD